jgi:dihydrofolate synthase/folylpolyglutamate synthase
MNRENIQQTEKFQHYEQAVNWVTGLVSYGIKPGLKRMERLAELLGHPHRRLKFIHVAGTNGKGSTCAFLSKVLIDCGYQVGTFTSPYLEKFTNRIEINGKNIPEHEVLVLVNKIKPIVDEIARTEHGQPTMFEVVTSMALVYFAEEAYPDYVVWETGLGGRLDCTNIVNPIVSVITNVGHDHMEILGDTLAKVAEEKAGIIKPGIPVISTVEQPEVIEVIKRKAQEKKSSLYLLGEQFQFRPLNSGVNEQSLSFSGPFQNFEHVPVSLNGSHQMKNAAVALMTLEVLRQYYATIIDEEHVISGIGQTVWPGRLEMISYSPRILLDGAHNPEGAATLAEALKHTYSYRKVHFMVGMLALKNHQAYLRHILPLVDTLIITEPDFRNKMEAEKLQMIAQELLIESNQQVTILLESSWKLALDRLRGLTQEDDLAVVSGTLYLISDVRSWILHHSDSEKGW